MPETPRVTIRLTDEHLAKAEAIRLHHGLPTITEVVRAAIEGAHDRLPKSKQVRPRPRARV